MFCERCGKQIPDHQAFCMFCGAKVTPLPPSDGTDGEKGGAARKKNAAAGRPADGHGKNGDGAGGSGKPPRRRRKWPFVLLGILLVFLALTIWLALRMFPLEVSFRTPELETTTTDGSFRHITVELHSNQPLRAVSYALNPADPDEAAGYTETTCDGGLMTKTLEIDRLEVPPGASTLYVRAETWFGERVFSLTLESEIGYTSAPQPEAFVEVQPGTQLVSNELIVVFHTSAGDAAIERLVEEYDGEIVGQTYFLDQYQIRFTGSGEDYINEIKQRLEQEEIVEAVYYNVSFETETEAYPNDSKYDSWDETKPNGNNWGLECIDAPGAWEYQDEMSTVKVGVIDSSLHFDHEDLQIDPSRTSFLPTDDFHSLKSLESYYDKYVDSHTCQSSRCVFCSQKDHGTHCTGIIGALANNDEGVCGVNWNAEMYFATWWYYTSPEDGQLAMYDTTNGWMYEMTWLVMNGCRVVSVSIGSASPSEEDEYDRSVGDMYNRMVAKLEEAGYDFVVAKAAGNSNDNASDYALNRVMTRGESARAHTIIVGAVANASSLTNRLAAWMSDVDRIYNMASYSNYGDLIDVTAPGSKIYSTVFDDRYANMSGTSMATPMVAGVASLLYAIDENLTYDFVKTIVCCTGDLYCAKNTEVYSIVNAALAVEWIRDNAEGRLPERELPTVGFVTGLVQDAQTMELIESAAVLITNDETGAAQETAAEDGTYYSYLAPGRYTMQFAADGYLPETVYGVEIVDGVVNYNVLLNLVPAADAQGTATGRIVDAFDASSIAQAELTVYAGVNSTAGTPVATARSDDGGNYSLTLDPGNYTVCASADGYVSGSTTILILADETRSAQDCTLTPVLKEGEMRVVLTWGEYPSDLDSHMVGPTPNGEGFHTYYVNRNCYVDGEQYDNLDVDDTTSYGPETTSVYVGVNGTYTFYVHNYTDRDAASSSTLATSGAQVKLYVAGQDTPIVYNVPNQPGTLWTVFSVRGGVVTPINEMSYHTDPATVGE